MKTPTRLVFIGAGGTAKDIISALPHFGGAYEPVGFLDDAPEKRGEVIMGLPVMGKLADAAGMAGVKFVNCVGSPANFSSRQRLIDAIGVPDDRFETLVHPSAIVSSDAVIGSGTIVYPFAFIGGGVRIGRQTLLLSHVSINHGASIGDYSIVASSAALLGDVKVGSAAYIGAGAMILQNVTIGDSTLVGMGAVVLHDLPGGVSAAGVPARVIKVQTGV